MGLMPDRALPPGSGALVVEILRQMTSPKTEIDSIPLCPKLPVDGTPTEPPSARS